MKSKPLFSVGYWVAPVLPQVRWTRGWVVRVVPTVFIHYYYWVAIPRFSCPPITVFYSLPNLPPLWTKQFNFTLSSERDLILVPPEFNL